MSKVRHVLGISGGKDSAALAIYVKTKYPSINLEFYTCDTGKELDETYQLIKNLEIYLGIKIELLQGAQNSSEDPFDHFLKMYGGFLPSSQARWCTKKLKLEPFENYVGTDPVISYVGIRGDEEREGYISTKKNIQSIFPFRKNIWSQDVVQKMLSNQNIEQLIEMSSSIDFGKNQEKALLTITRKLDTSFTIDQKLNVLLDANVKAFNHLVFDYLKTTDYPLATEATFPLLENDEVLLRDDIFKILKESGVGVPAYYNKIDFEINGKKGEYARSRSGCFFCFFQQKIEWVWLYEQHKDLYLKAMEYEKDGYTWAQGESLEDIIKPERIEQIKEEYIKRMERKSKVKSPYLVDILDDAEGEGCAACFI
ncbi:MULTISPECIES: phosphoadenosine phosphosulfate reductase family protein [Aequorivita]|uniref:Phosphoadenosine phosphosulfate reductase family protein n=1 Tax=Aequorivita iocasae TaxID=2803865 RepID=A0ABX7DPD3_9FLAO|nr:MULTISPECIES: phosphoadenosine phosphosulfate reductase family protein [Aequorivita]QQX75995.1 phosphoadenosine phosphosulfate reductase family protein [Aequorivita iocasae]UCA55456.1 phosphoadenosine phosphosulfate reductase family protein [Aequorivita sp. F7]